MSLNPYIEATPDIDLAALGGYMQLCNAPLVAWAISIGQSALEGHPLNPSDLVAARPTLRALLWDRRVVDDRERVALAMALHAMSQQDSVTEALGLPAEMLSGLRAA